MTDLAIESVLAALGEYLAVDYRSVLINFNAVNVMAILC